MKALLLLPLIAAPILMTGCETVVVDRYPRRTAVVEYDRYPHRHGYYDRDVDRYPRRPGYYERDVVVANPRPRRDVVVVAPRPAYRSQVAVRYYSDSRGRYYIRDGRRVYSNAGSRYY